TPFRYISGHVEDPVPIRPRGADWPHRIRIDDHPTKPHEMVAVGPTEPRCRRTGPANKLPFGIGRQPIAIPHQPLFAYSSISPRFVRVIAHLSFGQPFLLAKPAAVTSGTHIRHLICG